MIESERICREREKVEERFKMETSVINTPVPSEPLESIERIRAEHEAKESAHASAFRAFLDADHAHWQYAIANTVLTNAIRELHVVLMGFEWAYNQAPLYAHQRAKRDYLAAVLQPHIDAMRAAKTANNLAGEATAAVLDEARERFDPRWKAELAPKIAEADTATKFCQVFLAWMNKYEDPTISQGE